ncbi:MAG TPA: hypothetical protein VJX29_02460 [Candidatus Acidoferrales bacterium]|nr:hypothetical protein [Candidatus Acidoferrales bacterium]
MKPIEQGLRRAGGRLLASPGAVFVAVLTVGLAIGSLGHHTGLYRANAASGWRSNVVLACPRSGAPAHSTAAEATSSASTSWQDRSASASNSSADSPAGDATNPDGSPEKQPAGESGKSPSGSSFSMPLPDFNAPELSRFISPL